MEGGPVDAQPQRLHLVDPATGEVVDAHTVQQLEEQVERLTDDLAGAERDLRSKRGQISKLKSELSQALGVEPESKEIFEVLEFWNVTAKKGRCKVVVGSERWLKVRARLREQDLATRQPCYSVAALKAAVVGALLSDFHVQKGYLDAATIFRDSKTVDDHLARAVGFKQRTGVSALAVVDELAGAGLRWLADRCSCGHLFLSHLRGGPRPDGTTPCSQCACESMDLFHAKVERWKAEREGGRG